MRHLAVLLTAIALLAAMVAPTAALDLQGTATAVECDADLPLRLGEDQPPRFGVLQSCPGIRPGAYHSVEGAGCTFNFVFRGTSTDEEGNPVDEGLFIGTAGHCVFDSANGDEVYAPGEGHRVTDGQGQPVGEVAYGVDEDALDFALIRIDDAREDDVDPAVCFFGGPVALGGGLSRGDLVHHYGNGLAFGDTVQGRTGVADNYSDGGTVLNFNSGVTPGDSGSSLIDEAGNAVGVVVRISGPDTGANEATDLSFHLQRAEEFTGIDFELQTAPLTPEGGARVRSGRPAGR